MTAPTIFAGSVAREYSLRMAKCIKHFDYYANIHEYEPDAWREAMNELKAMARDLRDICDEFETDVDNAVADVIPEKWRAAT